MSITLDDCWFLLHCYPTSSALISCFIALLAASDVIGLVDFRTAIYTVASALTSNNSLLVSYSSEHHIIATLLFLLVKKKKCQLLCPDFVYLFKFATYYNFCCSVKVLYIDWSMAGVRVFRYMQN